MRPDWFEGRSLPCFPPFLPFKVGFQLSVERLFIKTSLASKTALDIPFEKEICKKGCRGYKKYFLIEKNSEPGNFGRG